MGTLTVTTTASDPSGDRSSGGSISPGGSHTVLSHAELATFSHAIAWMPGPAQAPVSVTVIADTPNAGVSMSPTAISGQYEDVFPIESVEWTMPQGDPTEAPVRGSATSWDDVPDDIADLISFKPSSVQDAIVTYTVTVVWLSTSAPPVPGPPDVFTIVDPIYMDFWSHKDSVVARAK